MDDRGIVALYLRRDETAIRQTAEKYGSRLRTLAYGIVNDLQTAEECENDTYMEAWNTIPPHEPSDYFYAFLARITRHISLNRCRDRDRFKRHTVCIDRSVGRRGAERPDARPIPHEEVDAGIGAQRIRPEARKHHVPALAVRNAPIR